MNNATKVLVVVSAMLGGITGGLIMHAWMSRPAETVVVVAAAIIAIVATALVFHKQYEDGLVGRLCLVGMVIAAVARVIDLTSMGGSHTVSTIGVLIWASTAGFLLRHYWRFRRWKHTGAHDWRDADAASSCGKIAKQR